MTSLISGDRVLDVCEDGALRTTTIIVNQHRDSVGEHRPTKILTLKYVGGELSLTLHHMIHLDGELQPASAARAASPTATAGASPSRAGGSAPPRRSPPALCLGS